MRWIISKVAGMGDYLVSLSDRARMQLVLLALLLLGGGGVYKLIISIERFNEPLTTASPEQLLKPMEQIFLNNSSDFDRFQQSRQQNLRELDSLAKVYTDKK